jgi:acyl transferase domain-containing protein/enoyl-CoA hydratase/carnithine racemase/pimeloyl-ACP methyl ester carboxylesterase/acyl carrier protein/NAD(P)-dependent dehydrogenase (short-subunit alcohol dehydrogenase family)/ubiquinone/menaquinone biosynthesis C-methylase UbiE
MPRPTVADGAWAVRTTLAADDFIPTNHRVYDVPIVPGVTFFDLIHRATTTRWPGLRGVELSDVLFHEPVTTAEDHGRVIGLAFGPEESGRRRLTLRSRWDDPAIEGGRWHDVLTARLVCGGPAPTPDLPLPELTAPCTWTEPMSVLYERTRAEGIIHGAPMTCTGTLHHGPGGEMLGLLTLAMPEVGRHFMLHPAAMDAATLAAFGQRTDVGDEPFIPLSARTVTIHRAVPTAFCVHVPEVERLATSRELLTNDLTIGTLQGEVAVRLTGLSCKRIRNRELIRRFDLPRTPGPQDAHSAARAIEPQPPTQLRPALLALVAKMSGLDPKQISGSAGFYELGMDSLQVLDLGEQLETLIGEPVYPTLLFEFSTIDDLSDHLLQTYPALIDGVAGRADRAGASPRVARSVLSADSDVQRGTSDPAPPGTTTPRPALGSTHRSGRPDGELLQRALRARPLPPGPRGLGPVALTGAVHPTVVAALEEAGVRTSRPALVDGSAASAAIQIVGEPDHDRYPEWPAPGLGNQVPAAVGRLRRLAAALMTRSDPPRVVVTVLKDRPLARALGAAAGVICREVPRLRIRVVAVEDATTTTLASALLDDLPNAGSGPVLAGPGGMYADAWIRLTEYSRADGFVPGGRYLVSGGSGRLATALAEHLVTAYGARVGLVGRSPASAAREAWAASLTGDGAEVRLVQADVTTLGGAKTAVASLVTAWEGIDGVHHLAGAARDGLFFRVVDDMDVWAPKVRGAELLDVATAGLDLHHFVLCSSISAIVANRGQSSYAGANGWQLGFAEARAARADRSGRSIAIAWPLWADGGMRLSQEALDEAEHEGGLAMPTAVGMAAYERALSAGEPVQLVAHGAEGRVRNYLEKRIGGEALDPPNAIDAPAVPSSEAARGGTPQAAPDNAIAIIAMTGCYPGAGDLIGFWDNLRRGSDTVTEVPAQRWDHAAYFAVDGRDGTTPSRWGGFLDGVDQFDPAFFSISRKDAERMDPQERLFLMAAWSAIEQAGYPPARRKDLRIGCFVGLMWNHYSLLADLDGGVAPTAMAASVSSRVSFCLDLHGPAMAIDTACSSSLSAIHVAASAIRNGEADLVIAGGVNLTLHPQKYLQLARGKFLSTEGKCRAFGAGGDGYVPGEGVGVVVLKPLRQALLDNDAVLAVLAGSAVNHSGRTGGFTVPSPRPQADLLEEAWRRSGWSADDVSYIEAHGTGTALGDPIEIEGLSRIFKEAARRGHRCRVGSVKTNVGHLESAAGMASVAKVVLQLQHRTLVPSLHAAELNPGLPLEGSGLSVQRVLEPWPAPRTGPRRAGISGFGASGANAHLLLEEAPDRPTPLGPYRPCAIVLSARSAVSLDRYAADLLRWLESRDTTGMVGLEQARSALAGLVGIHGEDLGAEDVLLDLGFSVSQVAMLADALKVRADQLGTCATLSDVARLVPATRDPVDLVALEHTLLRRRTAMARRAAVVVSSVGELRLRLEEWAAGSRDAWATGVADPEDPRTGFGGDLGACATAWCAGSDPWPMDHAETPVTVPAPPCPFELTGYWVGRWRSTGEDTWVPSRPRPEANVSEATQPAPVGASPAPARTQHQIRQDAVIEPPGAAAAGDEPRVTLTDLGQGIRLIKMIAGSRGNLLTSALLTRLRAALDQAAAEARVAIITGRPGVFSLGADAGGLSALAARETTFAEEPFAYRGLLDLPIPVIAAIDGDAAGGGLSFGLSADVVVLSATGRYVAPYLRYGFTPGMGASYHLTARLGAALAEELLLSGAELTGAQLASRGCGCEVVAETAVLETALVRARAIAALPPSVVRVWKQETASRRLRELAPVIERELELHAQVLGRESSALVATRLRVAPSGATEDTVDSETPVLEPTAREGAWPADLSALAATEAGTLSSQDLHSCIVDSLCRSLHAHPGELEDDRPFTELGLDSIGVIELVRDLNDAFHLTIEATDIYDHPTTTRLIPYLADLVGRNSVQLAHAIGGPTSTPSPRAPGATDPDPPEPARLFNPALVVAPSARGPLSLKVTLPAERALQPVAIPGVNGADRPARPAPYESTVCLNPGPDAIAVIGMAGAFPDAPDLDTFWRNLREGRCSICDVPPERWDAEAHYSADRLAPDRTISRWGAFLADIDQFDERRFQISPAEAESIDPQQRIFLQTAVQAVEDAGYLTEDDKPRPWGVYAGCAAGDYSHLLAGAGKDSTAQAFLGLSTSILPARVGYLLDLTGPTLSVDTACSSSLLAVHLAAEAIRHGDCDVALAGGVALMLTPRMHVLTSKSGMLSPTGVCRPFCEGADGIVLGEACGVVVLKRYARAVADGDQIHGVLLATGTNGDGRTNGITAPSASSQAALLRQVHRRAGIAGCEIGYIEAHGTGTPLGDPIELRAMSDALALGPDDEPCWVGSVKGNVGHTTIAAGITSLLKVLLCLRHRTLVPSGSVGEPAAALRRERSLRLMDRATPWTDRAGRRVAGVSSFGFSGTNVHLVVAEPPPRTPTIDLELPTIVPISAATPEAVRERAAALSAWLEDAPEDTRLPDVAWTLARRRTHLAARRAVVGASVAEVRDALAALAAGRLESAVPERLRAIVERIESGADVDWAGLYPSGRPAHVPTTPFSTRRYWPATGNGTPATFDARGAVAVPTVVAARERPAVGLPTVDMRRTVLVDGGDWRLRDHLLAGRRVLPGAATLAFILAADTPAVTAGLDSVRWIAPVAPENGGSVELEITESGADISVRWRGATVARARRATTPGPVPARVDVAALKARCPTPVDPVAHYAALAAAGLHYGPAFRVVADGAVGTDEAVAVLQMPAQLPSTMSHDPLHAALVDGAMQALAWIAPSDTETVMVPFAVGRVRVHAPLPADVLVHACRTEDGFALRLLTSGGSTVASLESVVLRPLPGAWPAGSLGVPQLRVLVPEEEPLAPVAAEPGGRTVVLAAPEECEGRRVRALLTELANLGSDVQALAWPARLETDWFQTLRAERLVALPPAGSDTPERAIELTVRIQQFARAAVAARADRTALRLVVVTTDPEPISGIPHAANAAVGGAVRAFRAEFPAWRVTYLDAPALGDQPARLAEAILNCPDRPAARVSASGLTEIRLRERSTPLPAGAIGGVDQVHLIIGGSGGIGGVLARRLAGPGARLALLGRRERDREMDALLAELSQAGATATYLRVDITEPGAIVAAIDAVAATLGSITHVYHLGMVLDDASLARLTPDRVAAVMAPKTTGSAALIDVLRDRDPVRVVFFSSAITFVPPAGQGPYAAATAYQDALAVRAAAGGLRVTTVNWGFWGSVGAVATFEHQDRFKRLGIASIEPSDGMAALDGLIGADLGRAVVVSCLDPASAGFAVVTGDHDRTADPFRELDGWALRRTCATVAALGLGPDEEVSTGALLARLGAPPDRYGRLMEAILVALVRGGYLTGSPERCRRSGSDPEAWSHPAAADDLLTEHPHLAPHVSMVERCLEHLENVMTGRRTAASVLFATGTDDIAALYQQEDTADRYHRHAAAAVVAAATGRPARLRVLEVGAGTGASSAFVLRALREAGVEFSYRFTDVSRAFLERARTALAPAYPELEFATLDIERPDDQDQHDVVVATNVLHATADITQTLANVRRLLAPGGRVVINEVMSQWDFLTVIFGLTDGWWRFEDSERRLPQSPLLSIEQWRHALAEAGFDPLEALGAEPDKSGVVRQAVLVAARTSTEVAWSTGPPVTGSSSTKKATSDGDRRGQLTKLGGQGIRTAVRRVIAGTLGLDPDILDDDEPFDNYGLDSLLGLDVLAVLERDLGALPSTTLFDHSTIARLATYVLEAHTDRAQALVGGQDRSDVAAIGPRAATSGATAVEVGSTVHRPSGSETVTVAIVGVAGQYPGGATLPEFWELLRTGGRTAAPIPAERWDMSPYLDADPTAAQHTVCGNASLLPDITGFDPGFFGILPSECDAMDPQERLFLSCAYELLESTGHTGETTRVPNTGVFVGVMYGAYGQLGATLWSEGRLAGATSSRWSLANRVSYTLDLTGPSLAVDTACSSSLMSVHLAAESLRRGECDLAIAGGVNVILHPAHHVSLSSLNMLSPDGQCHVFDAGANGFVPGEGVGAVLLKRLSDAESAGDPILAVLRASLSNASGRTKGYTVPSPSAQADLLRRTWRAAGVDPGRIGYVEAHGTGTRLGDPIELAGLTACLREGQRLRPCLVGSVKANVGHLEGAAGIVALTKVLLQLQHRTIAPCAGLTTVNPAIDIDPALLQFPVEPTEWAGDEPLVAGVSSFGAGGANVHVVVEEHRSATSQTDPRPIGRTVAGVPPVLCLSAPTEQGLSRLIDAVVEQIDRTAPEQAQLAALCATSQLGRRHFAERLTVEARTVAELRGDLVALRHGQQPRGREHRGRASRITRRDDDVGDSTRTLLADSGPDAVLDAWVAGRDVDLAALWEMLPPVHSPLPPTPTQPSRYWLSPTFVPIPSPARAPASLPAPEGTHPRIHAEAPRWRPLDVKPSDLSGRRIGVYAPDPATVAALADAAQRAGASDIAVAADLARIPEAEVVLLAFGGHDEPEVGERAAADPHLAVLPVGAVLRSILGSGNVRRLIVSQLEPCAPEETAVAGLLRTAEAEASMLRCTLVTHEPPVSPDDLAARIVAAAGTTEPELRCSGGRWLRRELAPAVLSDPHRWRWAPGTTLVTGGSGRLARVVAERLLAKGVSRVVLVSRSPAPTWVGTRPDIEYRRADVTDRVAMTEILDELGSSLTGLVHCAGVTSERRLVDARPDELTAPWLAKATAAALLDELTVDCALKHVVLFGSVVGEVGNVGQGGYAAANRYLSSFARWREELRRAGRRRGQTIAVSWGMWESGGMAPSASMQRILTRRTGMVALSDDAAMTHLEAALAGGLEELSVVAMVGESSPVAPSTGAAGGPAGSADVAAWVGSTIRDLAASFLRVDPTEVPLEEGLLDLGFDSISLTDLVDQINRDLMLALSPTSLFESATLADFVNVLTDRHADTLAVAFATAHSDPGTVQPPAPDPVPALVTVPSEVSVARPAVVVTGLSARLPGAPDIAALWELLVRGERAYGPIPPERAALVPELAGLDLTAGIIAGIDQFDAGWFRITPHEAALMDPQQRLVLQSVVDAVESTGHSVESLAGSSTGLFIGVSTADYADLLSRSGLRTQAHTASGIAHSVLSGRVSHLLDLHGPCESVDTACSSSLVALHRAKQAVLAGECDRAIVVGVNALLSPALFIAFAESGMLSSRGQCTPFGRGADGYVRGEGVVSVVIAREDVAAADGDPVLARVLGSGVTHGGRATSLTAPNLRGQAEAILRAHREAQVDPASVTVVEAHGTGTQLGDPVEIASLSRALAERSAETGTTPPQKVLIGSVKGNVGHLESAAGLAGLAKLLLAMRHGIVPPSVGVAELNPLVVADGSPVRVASTYQLWPGDGTRRGGVSSFGFGGVNAHVVLEHVPHHTEPDTAGTHVLRLSAPDPEQQRDHAARLASWLMKQGPPLEAVAWTLANARRRALHRAAVVAGSTQAAAEALQCLAEGRPHPRLVTEDDKLADLSELSDDAASALEAAAAWVRGEVPDPDEHPPARVLLPPSPWATTQYWFEADPAQGLHPTPQVSAAFQPGETVPTDARSTLTEAIPVSSTGFSGRTHTPVTLAPMADPAPARPLAQPLAKPTSGHAAGDSAVVAHPNSARGADQIAAQIVDDIAEITAVPADDVDPGVSFVDLGLDSIMRMDVAKRIANRWGQQVDSGILYEHDSVRALAAHLVGLLAKGSEGERGSASDLAQMLGALTGRATGPDTCFLEAGYTSFDMLQVIGRLEATLGPQPKTLLFDRPSVRELWADLTQRFGVVTAEVFVTTPAQPAGGQLSEGHGISYVRKRDLHLLPELREQVAACDGLNAREQGLAGVHIAPIVALLPSRDAYFHVATHGEHLFAWSYSGPPEQYAANADLLYRDSAARGLNACLLSMEPVAELGGERAESSPIGAIQRIEHLSEFTLAGGAASRLRYLVNKFSRTGKARVREYLVGSERDTDQAVSHLISLWCATKGRPNSYVGLVQEQLDAGKLGASHRMFLTTLDEQLTSAVIITRIPSQNAYLLDLEFYPADMPLGGLEFTCCRIIEQLVAEGVETFSLGASFGVQLTDRKQGDPQVRQGLDELASVGIFGRGNYQFKSKFRPSVAPLYLVQAGERRPPLAQVIVMIANTDVNCTVPGLVEPTRPATSTGSASTLPDAEEPPEVEWDLTASRMDRIAKLQGVDYDVLRLHDDAVPVDALTDSWAEAAPDRLPDHNASDRVPDWLPMPTVVLTTSGRDAEDLLLRCWPEAAQTLHHTAAFPSWETALVDHGWPARRLPISDNGAVDTAIAAAEVRAGDIVLVELCTNALGGIAVDTATMAGLRKLANDAGATLVVDASRVVSNAHALTPDQLWPTVTALLECAEAVTMSLTKEFGVISGGLVATRPGSLADRLEARCARRGQPLGRPARLRLLAALNDTDWVQRSIAERATTVRQLRQRLTKGGARTLPSDGHCVVVDVPIKAMGEEPMAAFLAWMYLVSGLRAAPHLLGIGAGVSASQVRIAVPVGVPHPQLLAAGQALAAAWRLMELEAPHLESRPQGGFRRQSGRDDRGTPRPGDLADGNATELRRIVPDVRRHILPLALGDVEVLERGIGDPLVLLHPFNIGASYFRHQFRDLADRFRVIAIHHSGQGATTAAADLSLNGLSSLCLAALEELQVCEPVHLLGSSFGGIIALATAVHHPEIVRKLILVGSSYKVGNRRQSSDVNRLPVVVHEDLDAIVASQPALGAGRAETEATLRHSETMDPRTGLRFLEALQQDQSLLPRLGELTTPTLILHGHVDTIIPVRTAHLLYGSIPGSELLEVPGAGHFSPLTHPDVVNAAIEEFITTGNVQQTRRSLESLVMAR